MAKPVVLITGAAGRIGRRLTTHFAASDCTLLLLDKVAPPGGTDVEGADLSEWGSWTERFRGADVVIHLAADAAPDAGWPAVARHNIDLTLNVFEAAARAGVRRVVFASTGFVVEGHGGSGMQIDEYVAPAPVNAYGGSKLACERIARFFSVSRGLSVICFRIGAIGGAMPDPATGKPEMPLWEQWRWLSDRDLCDAFARAVEAPDDIRFEIFNLVSDNEGMPWDMRKAERLLGFRAADGRVAVPPRAMSLRRRFGRRLKAVLRSAGLARAKKPGANPK